MSKLRVIAVALLLAMGFLLQVHYLSTYPQPILFGDPGAYYIVGQKLQQAAARILDGEPVEVVFNSIRGFLYFAGVGSFYAAIDALKPHDIVFFRLVLAGFNTLSMLGCFFLARRLAGTYVGGLVGLLLAAVYPSFAVQTGRIFPDPITGCLFVWSAYFYLEGVHRKSGKWMAAAGLGLSLALLVRSQLFNYFVVLLLLTVLLASPLWWSERRNRRLVRSLGLGMAPLTLVWLAIVVAVGNDLTQIESFGNFTFKQRYPYGFWQFLDSDGWMGPYRLGKEPYYRDLEAAAETDPDLATSYPRQLLFTARYVVSRADESVSMFLDNIYRLYDRPANDYKWDYPFAYSHQVLFQKTIVVLGVAGLTVFASTTTGAAGVFFVPFCLALLHGSSYPWPRFNQPAMPIFIAAAGAFLAWGCPHLKSILRHGNRRWRDLALAVGLLLVVSASGELLRMSYPEAARALRYLARLNLLGLPFLLVVRSTPVNRRRTTFAAMGWAFLAVTLSAHTLRDRSWHQTVVSMDAETPGIEQEITLSGEALARLRKASQTFLVFDLHIPEGNPKGVRVEVNGKEFAGSDLLPTMPRFGESTSAGGRDRRGYPQWWALPLDDTLLPQSAPALFHVKLMTDREGHMFLYGDRFRRQQRLYEGPSFGDWPHLAAVKLEYDGDYRLPNQFPLESTRTRSYVLTASGERILTPAVHRIRIITLKSNEGYLEWESDDLPGQKESALGSYAYSALGFYAYSGNKAPAELLIDGRPVLDFPLGSPTDFDVEAPPFRLCYQAEPPRGGMAYGGYFLTTPAGESGGALSLMVRFRSGMSIERMFFSLDMRDHSEDLAALAARCNIPSDTIRVNGAARVIDASLNAYPEHTGRWSVAEIF